MSATRARLATVATLLVVAIIALAGCGLVSSSGTFRQASLPDGSRPLDGAKITVTSKSFTESVILGKITATYLAAAGAKVTDLTGAPGSEPGTVAPPSSAWLRTPNGSTANSTTHHRTK